MGTADDKILTDLKYMIKKVRCSLTSFPCVQSLKSQEYARQKSRATKLGAVYLKKVEDDAQEITEGTSHIHSWIRNQSHSKTLTLVKLTVIQTILSITI